jgi:hypothetical protein
MALERLMAATDPRFRAIRLNILNAAFGAGAVAGLRPGRRNRLKLICHKSR